MKRDILKDLRKLKGFPHVEPNDEIEIRGKVGPVVVRRCPYCESEARGKRGYCHETMLVCYVCGTAHGKGGYGTRNDRGRWVFAPRNTLIVRCERVE